MTKQELYDALKARGVKLGRGVNFFTEEALQTIWDKLEEGEQNEDPGTGEEQEQQNEDPGTGEEQEQQNEDPGTGEEQNEEPKLFALEFDTAGWCPELGKAYNQGVCLPETFEEYEALRKYASRELPR